MAAPAHHHRLRCRARILGRPINPAAMAGLYRARARHRAWLDDQGINVISQITGAGHGRAGCRGVGAFGSRNQRREMRSSQIKLLQHRAFSHPRQYINFICRARGDKKFSDWKLALLRSSEKYRQHPPPAIMAPRARTRGGVPKRLERHPLAYP